MCYIVENNMITFEKKRHETFFLDFLIVHPYFFRGT